MTNEEAQVLGFVIQCYKGKCSLLQRVEDIKCELLMSPLKKIYQTPNINSCPDITILFSFPSNQFSVPTQLL